MDSSSSFNIAGTPYLRTVQRTNGQVKAKANAYNPFADEKTDTMGGEDLAQDASTRDGHADR